MQENNCIITRKSLSFSISELEMKHFSNTSWKCRTEIQEQSAPHIHLYNYKNNKYFLQVCCKIRKQGVWWMSLVDELSLKGSLVSPVMDLRIKLTTCRNEANSAVPESCMIYSVTPKPDRRIFVNNERVNKKYQFLMVRFSKLVHLTRYSEI